MKVQKRNVSMVSAIYKLSNFNVLTTLSPLKITGVKSSEINERVGKVAELLN